MVLVTVSCRDCTSWSGHCVAGARRRYSSASVDIGSGSEGHSSVMRLYTGGNTGKDSPDHRGLQLHQRVPFETIDRLVQCEAVKDRAQSVRPESD
jgi:hypothetical protein